MPSYFCTTLEGRLTAEQKRESAGALTRRTRLRRRTNAHHRHVGALNAPRHYQMIEFKPDLLLALHDAAWLVHVVIDQRARIHDMTRAQWAAMLWLERKPGITQKELSDLLKVEPVTVARLVDRLEQRGTVERRADPTDRRIWRLHLLREALPLLGEIKAERAGIAAVIADGIDEPTLDTMLQGLLCMRVTLCSEVRGSCRPEEGRDEPSHQYAARVA